MDVPVIKQEVTPQKESPSPARLNFDEVQARINSIKNAVNFNERQTYPGSYGQTMAEPDRRERRKNRRPMASNRPEAA